jgi:hypothetical protein
VHAHRLVSAGGRHVAARRVHRHVRHGRLVRLRGLAARAWLRAVPRLAGWLAGSGCLAGSAAAGAVPRPTFQERRLSPVCRSQTLHIRLREEATSVRLSGLTASAVMGSESCRAEGRGGSRGRAAGGAAGAMQRERGRERGSGPRQRRTPGMVRTTAPVSSSTTWIAAGRVRRRRGRHRAAPSARGAAAGAPKAARGAPAAAPIAPTHLDLIRAVARDVLAILGHHRRAAGVEHLELALWPVRGLRLQLAAHHRRAFDSEGRSAPHDRCCASAAACFGSSCGARRAEVGFGAWRQAERVGVESVAGC